MAVNYDDKRFQQVNNEKATALNEVNGMYNNMITSSDKYYQDQINATNKYAEQQKELQQQGTDFAIEKIEQQKDLAKQDYTKEQKGAYSDYQKQSNTYGANAEAMASKGLAGTGYAESSQVSMYNAYQNRVATAKESYNRAIINYDNGIKDAQLQNNSALAEISYNALKTQLELSLQGFQYKNTLLQQQLSAKNEIEDRYYNRWQNVLNQINTENSLAEQQRQFNEQMALQREQISFQKAQALRQSQIQRAQAIARKPSSKTGSKSYNSAGGISAIAKASTPKGSKNAQSLEKFITSLPTGIAGKTASKTTAREIINIAYKQGKIDANDVSYLANRFGL